MTVDQDDGSGVAHCFRCGYVETYRGDRPTKRPGGPVVPTEASTRYEALSEFGSSLWAACQPLAGEALAYLQARACVIPPSDGDLRWHPR